MHRWQEIAKAAVVLLAVVTAFLAALAACELAIRPAGLAARQAVTFLPVADDGTIDRSGQPFLASYSPEPVYRAFVDQSGPHVAFQIPFHLAAPKEELAFFIGATPGLLMALHTWGRNLSRHPHLHCLVTAGGLDEFGQWKSSRAHVPISAMPLKSLFRGRLLGLLGQPIQAVGQGMGDGFWL